MTFSDELHRFQITISTRSKGVFDKAVDGVFESIVFGSPLTASPGQPEDLRSGQWVRTDNGDFQSLISTDDPSALSVEDGVSHKHGNVPIHLHSPIGGSHSIKLTALSFERIVEKVTQEVVGSGG